MATINKRIVLRMTKELRELETSPPDGVICHPLEDNIVHLQAEITGPSDTPYEGGVFRLDIQIPDNYPLDPPNCLFLTKVYHPNIDDQGRICLDILKKTPPNGAWTPSLTVAAVLLSLRLLLANPNPYDPLLADVAKEYKDDRALFLHKAREYTRRHATANSDCDSHLESSNDTISRKSQAAPNTHLALSSCLAAVSSSSQPSIPTASSTTTHKGLYSDDSAILTSTTASKLITNDMAHGSISPNPQFPLSQDSFRSHLPRDSSVVQESLARPLLKKSSLLTRKPSMATKTLGGKLARPIGKSNSETLLAQKPSIIEVATATSTSKTPGTHIESNLLTGSTRPTGDDTRPAQQDDGQEQKRKKECRAGQSLGSPVVLPRKVAGKSQDKSLSSVQGSRQGNETKLKRKRLAVGQTTSAPEMKEMDTKLSSPPGINSDSGQSTEEAVPEKKKKTLTRDTKLLAKDDSECKDARVTAQSLQSTPLITEAGSFHKVGSKLKVNHKTETQKSGKSALVPAGTKADVKDTLVRCDRVAPVPVVMKRASQERTTMVLEKSWSQSETTLVFYGANTAHQERRERDQQPNPASRPIEQRGQLSAKAQGDPPVPLPLRDLTRDISEVRNRLGDSNRIHSGIRVGIPARIERLPEVAHKSFLQSHTKPDLSVGGDGPRSSEWEQDSVSTRTSSPLLSQEATLQPVNGEPISFKAITQTYKSSLSSVDASLERKRNLLKRCKPK